MKKLQTLAGNLPGTIGGTGEHPNHCVTMVFHKTVAQSIDNATVTIQKLWFKVSTALRSW